MRGTALSRPRRVGVLGIAEDRVDGAVLDDAAGIHDHDTLGEAGDDSKIVRDEQHGEAAA